MPVQKPSQKLSLKTVKKKTFSVLGTMSGTSCDALDLAYLEFEREAASKNSFFCSWTESLPYPVAFRKRILTFQNKEYPPLLDDMLALDEDLGRWSGDFILSILKKKQSAPDLIAHHGQTVLHEPEKKRTLQLGHPAWIAFKTGLTVLSHFRIGDLLAGGQGAPLVPLFHEAWVSQYFPELQGRCIIHNLGGISNLSFFSPKTTHAQGHFLGFDTGPANLWIDLATEEVTQGEHLFDPQGTFARKGKPDLKAIVKLLENHPFFQQRPPKSTGREAFPYSLFRQATAVQGNDLVATATEFTVRTILEAYKKEILPLPQSQQVKKIFFCGGGAANHFLIERLQRELQPLCASWEVECLKDYQNIEAQAFAYLGWKAWQGFPMGGPWTGAQAFGPPAQITPGQNWSTLLRPFNGSIPGF